MYYECKLCKNESPRGILPGATCGILFLVEGVIGYQLLLEATSIIFPVFYAHWWLLMWFALLLPGLVCGFFLYIIFCTLEWLLVSLVGCRKCRSHRLSFGRTHGFGL